MGHPVYRNKTVVYTLHASICYDEKHIARRYYHTRDVKFTKCHGIPILYYYIHYTYITVNRGYRTRMRIFDCIFISLNGRSTDNNVHNIVKAVSMRYCGVHTIFIFFPTVLFTQLYNASFGVIWLVRCPRVSWSNKWKHRRRPYDTVDRPTDECVCYIILCKRPQ